MGAANFNRLQNASKYYTLFLSRENEEGEIEQPETFEIEETISSIKERIENQEVHPAYFDDNYRTKGDNAHYLGSVYLNENFGDIEVELHIRCILYGGYYEGANLDYIIEYGYDGDTCEYESIKDFVEDSWNVPTSMNNGMLQIQQRNIKKWIEKKEPIVSKFIEEIFGEFAEKKLTLSAHFSNGEAIYEEIKK